MNLLLLYNHLTLPINFYTINKEKFKSLTQSRTQTFRESTKKKPKSPHARQDTNTVYLEDQNRDKQKSFQQEGHTFTEQKI